MGDEDAGQRLYRRHLPAVARFFRDKVREDLEELIQATFLGLLEGHARLRDDGSNFEEVAKLCRLFLWCRWRCSIWYGASI